MANKSKSPLIVLNMAVDVIKDWEAEVLLSNYAQRISDAGGIPLPMPSIEKDEIRETFLDMADGVVLIGGKDYDSRFFGEEPHPMADMSRKRPACDIDFARALLKRDMPVLGICAGCQLLNIVTGGKLIQHLDNTDEHRFTEHSAKIISDGFFARALGAVPGTEIRVNSYHHQAVSPDFLGNGVKITATAFDGTVEVIEIDGERMMLGLQFHPERMDEFAPKIFGLLIEQAAKYRASKKQ